MWNLETLIRLSHLSSYKALQLVSTWNREMSEIKKKKSNAAKLQHSSVKNSISLQFYQLSWLQNKINWVHPRTKFEGEYRKS